MGKLFQSENQPVQSTVFLSKKVEAVDNRNNPLKVEKSIEPQKFEGVWNKGLSEFNQFKSNNQTILNEHLALEKIKNEQASFIKDFYLDVNASDLALNRTQNQFNQSIGQYFSTVKSASQIASDLLREQQMISALKNRKIKKFTKTVKNRLNKSVRRDKQQYDEQKTKHIAEIKRLYRQAQEAVQHILSCEGESKFKRVQANIQMKEGITPECIKTRKIEDFKTAQDMYKDVRLLISKRTDEFELLRQAYGDDFMTDLTLVRDLSQSARSGDSQSLISDRLSKLQDDFQKRKEEDPKIARFFDLKKFKEGKQNLTEDQLKQMIRRILMTQILSDAEHQLARKTREELEVKEKMKNQDPNLAKMLEEEERRKKSKEKREKLEKQRKREEKLRKIAQSETKPKKNQPSDTQQTPKRNRKIDKIDPSERTKKEYFNSATDVFLTVGQMFEKTNNYSKLFDKKFNEQQYKNLQKQKLQDNQKQI